MRISDWSSDVCSSDLADHQILEAVALVDAAVDGDPVGLDFEQAGIGKGGGAPLEPDDEIDLPLLGQESHGNTAGRTPDGALMVSGALCVPEIGRASRRGGVWQYV